MPPHSLAQTPMNTAPQPPIDPDAATDATPSHGVRVLLVDDNSADTLLISSLLDADPRVRTVWRAADGQAGLEILSNKKVRPDLVLLDINMPRLNGFDFLSEFRMLRKGKTTPVVMLTSSAQGRDFHRSLIRSANSYLVKPPSFDELRRKLAKLVKMTAEGRYLPKLIDVDDVAFDRRTEQLAH